MKVLNICLLAPYTEGYSYQDNLLTEYQHKLGHDVTILTTTTQRDSSGKITHGSTCDYIQDNGVRLIRIKRGNIIQNFFTYYPQIFSIINNIAPDLIFIHGLCQLTPYFAIKYKKKNPDVILKADNHQDLQICKTHGFPYSQMIWFWRQCWKTWINYFSKIYGTTNWRKQFAIELYGIPDNKVDVLLMGVDSDNLPKDTENVRFKTRRELGFADNNFVFVHGGKMDDKKRTIEVIEAFTKVNDPNIRLLLFGAIDNSIKEKFEFYINRDHRIKYIGYVDSKIIHRYFFASDFSLFPGNHSVLWEESIGCKLPGLFKKYGDGSHTNICGNSITVQPDATIEQISNIISEYTQDPNKYKELKEASIMAANFISYHDIAVKSLE